MYVFELLYSSQLWMPIISHLVIHFFLKKNIKFIHINLSRCRSVNKRLLRLWLFQGLSFSAFLYLVYFLPSLYFKYFSAKFAVMHLLFIYPLFAISLVSLFFFLDLTFTFGEKIFWNVLIYSSEWSLFLRCLLLGPDWAFL